MIVVSDTTPLISLLKINRIDLLEKLFGDVLIPQAVFDELTVNERYALSFEASSFTTSISVFACESISTKLITTTFSCLLLSRSIPCSSFSPDEEDNNLLYEKV